VSATPGTLKLVADHLAPHRDAIYESWVAAIREVAQAPEDELRGYAAHALDAMLDRLARGDAEGLLRDEARAAEEAVRIGTSLGPFALAIRTLDRACVPFLLAAIPDRARLAEALLALDELADRRLEILLRAQEDETGRRLVEAEEQAAAARDRARQLAQASAAVKASERRSERRADQLALLASVVKRVAGILDHDRLLQEAASTIQARMNHTFVAVVVLQEDGSLVGRWAGRSGVSRDSAGRAAGPPRGIIGRALRKRAPQVVPEVSVDPDYRQDVPGTRSEMAVPLIEQNVVVGAIDFQSEKAGAFDLDDVAAAEAIAEFLVIAIRNARLFAAARGA
jgi:putative methionine-R-sulfoxide reductase with GAF domain